MVFKYAPKFDIFIINFLIQIQPWSSEEHETPMPRLANAMALEEEMYRRVQDHISAFG
jgi:hypothetical protein